MRLLDFTAATLHKKTGATQGCSGLWIEINITGSGLDQGFGSTTGETNTSLWSAVNCVGAV